MSSGKTKGGWHRHPVLTNAAGGVLATATLGAVAQLAGWINIAGWWHSVLRATGVAWQWINASTPVPHWLITLMAAAVLAWLFVLVAFLTTNHKEGVRVFNALSYDNDVFFNMRWRWQWIPGVGPHNATPFCLNCDMQLFADQVYGAGVVGRIEFQCKDCRSVQYQTNDSMTRFEDLQHEVVLRVQRNLRAQIAEHERKATGS